ncbi:MAG: hypothetical protein NTW99_15420 [Chloroflexi bacterium]|nr:hypothetical protein [Chloroflexota bacterium]
MLNLGVLMFACRIESLRRLDLETDDERFLDNWCVFSRARSETVVCSKQMTNVLAALDHEQISAMRPDFLKTLIRRKQAADLYLLGHVMMAGDATGIFSSSRYHCPQCLTQNHQDGSKTSLHNVLEIKAVGWNGLALSVLTEPLLNPDDGTYDKQDCETKAFHRALPNLKELFPREPIVHLLDSLYCQGPVFQAIADCAQKFICCFKRGSIPTLYDEALELRKLNPNNRITRTFQREGHRVNQVYTWVNALEYQELKLDFVMCEETVDGKTTTFAFLTNFAVTERNVEIIAKGGRLRWTIENEGFNEQKTGYELEHFCDCKNLDVMLALYYLLQIAHLFMQLLARSDLVEGVTHLTFLAHLLLEALRNQHLSEDLFAPNLTRCQIRFAKTPT